MSYSLESSLSRALSLERVLFYTLLLQCTRYSTVRTLEHETQKSRGVLYSFIYQYLYLQYYKYWVLSPSLAECGKL